MLALGLAGAPVAIGYAMLNRGTAVSLINGYLIAVATLGIFKAFTSWRRKYPISLCVLGAFIPTALATVLLVTNMMGFVPYFE